MASTPKNWIPPNRLPRDGRDWRSKTKVPIETMCYHKAYSSFIELERRVIKLFSTLRTCEEVDSVEILVVPYYRDDLVSPVMVTDNEELATYFYENRFHVVDTRHMEYDVRSYVLARRPKLLHRQP